MIDWPADGNNSCSKKEESRRLQIDILEYPLFPLTNDNNFTLE